MYRTAHTAQVAEDRRERRRLSKGWKVLWSYEDWFYEDCKWAVLWFHMDGKWAVFWFYNWDYQFKDSGFFRVERKP